MGLLETPLIFYIVWMAPIAFGIAYDLNGSYTGALLMLTAVPIACAVAVLFIREPDLGPGQT